MSATPTGGDRKRKWDDGGEESPGVKVARNELSPGAYEAASAAAARIAASIAPVRPNNSNNSAASLKAKTDDGPYVKDIDIHDIRNRYLLTKGATQHQIQDETGASITTKGQWYPDKTLATEKDPPLYLHITATSEEILKAAVTKVEELIAAELGPLTEVRGPRRHEFQDRRPNVEEKVFISLEPLRNFNVRAKVVGPQGLFVKYIQSETGARVQIKGQGSGFTEVDTGRESDDPMHISISARDQGGASRAKDLAEDLMVVVKEEYEKARQVMDQWHSEQRAQQQALHAAQQPYMNQGYGGAYGGGYGQQAPLPSGDAPPPPPGSSAPPPPPGDGSQPPPPANGQAGGYTGYSGYQGAAAGGTPGQPGAAGAGGETNWQTLEQYANYYQAQASDPTYGSYYQAYASYYSQLAQQYKAAAASGQAPPAQAPPPPQANGGLPPA